MDIDETVEFLSSELDIPRSGHVRDTGRSVAHLRD
jgi:hypothetical protein